MQGRDASEGLLPKKRFNGIFRNLAVLAFFSILSVILSYPLVTSLTTSIPSPPWGDAWHVLTMFWYTKNAALGLNPDITLTYNSYIFYPGGTPVVWEFPFANAMSVPLQLWLGLPAAYNILWLLSFILAGYGAYLLARYLTGNDLASVFAGLVFAFSPYHFAHGLGHMGLLTIEWIPFCALYLLRLHRSYGLKDSILAGIFFILVAASDLHYLIYMSVFAALLLLYEAYSSSKDAGRAPGYNRYLASLVAVARKYIPFAVTALIGVIPLSYYMLNILASGNNFLQRPLSETIEYSADLLSYITPSSLHPVYGDWLMSHVYSRFTGNIAENTTFIGFTVLLLILCAFLWSRKERDIRFWLASGSVFLVLSLGPVLHVLGATTFSGVNIPLPYTVLSLIPVFKLDRTPSRYDVMVMLCAAVLSGYGMAALLERLKNIQLRSVVGVFLMLVLLLEFASVTTITPVTVPSFYRGIGNDGDTYALLEIPETYDYGAGVNIQYYQIYHNKPILGGQMARQPGSVWDFEKKTPVVNELTFLRPMPDILVQNESAVGTSLFNYYNIRYVIVHTDYLNSSQVQYCEDTVDRTLETEKSAYPEDGLIAYRVLNDTAPAAFMALGDGWYSLEMWNGTPGRWMKNTSSLYVICPGPGTYSLSFEAGSISGSSDMLISVNDGPATVAHVDDKIPGNTTPSTVKVNVTLTEGENVIRLSDTRPGIVPSQRGLWDDERDLNIAVQNVTLSSNDRP